MQLIRHFYFQGRCYVVFRSCATGEVSTFIFNGEGTRIAKIARYKRS